MLETTNTFDLVENQINLACLELRGQLYALDVAQVREIVRLQEITPLPMAPDLIEGVIDLRGSAITCFRQRAPSRAFRNR